MKSLREWARTIRRDVVAIWLAARDRRTPWYAKLAAAGVAAYALSPIDLIPDFIPVIGFLDELILLPLAIRGVVALIPAALMVEFRQDADRLQARPMSRAGAVFIVALWFVSALLVLWLFTSRLGD